MQRVGLGLPAELIVHSFEMPVRAEASEAALRQVHEAIGEYKKGSQPSVPLHGGKNMDWVGRAASPGLAQELLVRVQLNDDLTKVNTATITKRTSSTSAAGETLTHETVFTAG